MFDINNMHAAIDKLYAATIDVERGANNAACLATCCRVTTVTLADTGHGVSAHCRMTMTVQAFAGDGQHGIRTSRPNVTAKRKRFTTLPTEPELAELDRPNVPTDNVW